MHDKTKLPPSETWLRHAVGLSRPIVTDHKLPAPSFEKLPEQ